MRRKFGKYRNKTEYRGRLYLEYLYIYLLSFWKKKKNINLKPLKKREILSSRFRKITLFLTKELKPSSSELHNLSVCQNPETELR